MLTLRFLRTGRRNQAFFRIVLTEKSKPSDSGFIKALGWYNPHTKETSLEKEEILSWLDKGAKPSNSLSKLLLANKMKHKQLVFVPDEKKAPKKKEEKTEKPKMAEVVADEAPKEEKAEVVAENAEPKTEETEKPKETPTNETVGVPTAKEDVGKGK